MTQQVGQRPTGVVCTQPWTPSTQWLMVSAAKPDSLLNRWLFVVGGRLGVGCAQFYELEVFFQFARYLVIFLPPHSKNLPPTLLCC